MSYFWNEENSEPRIFRIIMWSIIAFLSLAGIAMWGCPRYGVWERGLSGKAELAKAEYNRKVAVAEAHAKMESASLLAQAEIERARGVAKANEIIGSSLKDHEEYLKYLWITSLQNPNKEIIYVPTEAMIPIMEAGRLK